MTSKCWIRPPEVPFPSVWRRCQGRRPMADGSIPSFVIQDVTPELEEAVLDNMKTYFLRDEPLCEVFHLNEDSAATADYVSMWREMLGQRVALVALLDHPTTPEPKVVAVNMTGVSYKGHQDGSSKWKSENTRTITTFVEACTHLTDVFLRYEVDEYMTALGLSVHPEFRGQGLGLELLLARSDIGRAVGLKLTATVFTAIESQKLAERAGFELLGEICYEDYKVNDQIVFPITKTKTSKLMAKIIA